MLRLVLLVWMSTGLLNILHAQLRRFYELSEPETYDTVDFTLKATSGISFVRHVEGGNPLNIFGNPDLDRINPSFHSSISNNTCHAKLILAEYRKSMVGDGLVFAMLGGKEEESENYWKFLLNDSKIYNLNLNYGIGSSDVDLGGTSIHRLKITTGSADVVVNYTKGPNEVEMDTFMVKVDLGSLEARELNLARAKNLVAEIGFGQGLLDFKNKLDNQCNVYATVGAGRLNVILPKDEPVIIHMKESPLCNVRMPESLEQVEKNVYVNMTYEARAENLLTIYVDVAMGAVSFAIADD
jgi:hypothetical protein